MMNVNPAIIHMHCPDSRVTTSSCIKGFSKGRAITLLTHVCTLF